MNARGPSRRTVIIAVAAAIVFGGVLSLLHHAHHAVATVPEGGSRFGAATPAAQESLLDALAPILASQSASGHGSSTRTSTISLARGVAQLFIVGLDGTQGTSAQLAPLRAHDWGGVELSSANYESAASATALTAAIAATATNAGDTAPLILFSGQGSANEPSLGARGSSASVTQHAFASAQALRAIGVNATLAPNADIGNITGEGEDDTYSSNPKVVTRLVKAALVGYRRARMISVIGNFPGDGAASQDPSLGAATVGLTLPELQARDLLPFDAVVSSAPAIQMSDALYDAFDGVTPATLLSQGVGLLRNQLAYRGVIVSGNLEDATLATGQGIGGAAVAALNAGCDMLIVDGPATDAQAAYDAVIEGIRDGSVDPHAVAQSLARVQALRHAYAR